MDRQISTEMFRTPMTNTGGCARRCARVPMILGIGVIGAVLLATVATPAAAASVPNPKVDGPIPATAAPGDPSHDYPFFATTVDLASYGYVEEEYFFEGTANRYSTPALATGSVIDSGHLYRTRMIVRRPASPESFSGTVLMEWQNVSFNYDVDAFWLGSYEHFLRRGYAWIGVSAQRASIHDPTTGIKAWSSKRYGTLDVTENGTILDDALCYDIFSQAAQAVKRPQGVDPMGGLPVTRILAVGGSQSANRLILYHNSIHLLAGVFDALMLISPTSAASLLRTDVDIKVFKVLTETDVVTRGQAATRQPDSDHFRRWEMAGTSHLPFSLVQRGASLQARDNVPPFPTGCDLPPWSRIPFFPLNAAYDHMIRWVKDNIPPPSAPDMEIVTLGPPVIAARDTYGNALGGIRLPQLTVATATNTGVNSGPGACSLYGSFQPFDAAALAVLYPDHMTYVIQVVQSTLDNLKAGFLVPEDAAATISDAVYSDIGGH